MTNNYSVLVIGTGNIAKKHSNILKKKNVNKITNISSRKFNLSFLKKNNNFDFAFICSPANMHLNHIKLLSKFEKDFLVEKPLSHENFDFKSFYKIFKKKKTLIKEIGYVFKHDQNAKWIKNQLSKIKKNSKIYVDIFCHSNFIKWRKKNFRKTVSSQKKLGGGVLNELSHEIHLALWLFGKLKIKLVKNYKYKNYNLDVEDHSIIKAYNSKAEVNFNLNMLSKINKRQIKIYLNKKIIFWDMKKNIIQLNNNGNLKTINKVVKDKFEIQVDNFLQTYKFKKKLDALHEGYKVVNFIHEAKKSRLIRV